VERNGGAAQGSLAS